MPHSYIASIENAVYNLPKTILSYCYITAFKLKPNSNPIANETFMFFCKPSNIYGNMYKCGIWYAIIDGLTNFIVNMSRRK